MFDVLLLVVLSGWLAGVHLGQLPLVDPDEPRSALVARLMVERGDWLVPHLPELFRREYPHYPVRGDLMVYLNKPPLFFWLEAAAMKVFGPTELAARLPSALAQVVTVLLVYAISRSVWGRRAGLLAGLVMTTATMALILGRVARMDAVLVALMAAMLLACLRLMSDAHRPRLWVALLYVSAGLGLLTKGPVAILIPGVAMVSTILLTGRWADIRRLRPLIGVAIMLLISAPWFLYMHYRFPPVEAGARGFLYEFFVRQNMVRATAETFGEAKPPGYLVAVLLAGFIPWTLFLPAAFLHRLRSDWRGRKRRPAGVLLLAWTAAVLVLFSASKTQFGHYVLPAFPPLAILTGAYLGDRLGDRERSRLFRLLLGATLALCLALAVVVILARQGIDAGRPVRVSTLVAVTTVLTVSLVCLVRRREAASVGLIVVAASVLLTFGLSTDPFGTYRRKTTKVEATAIKQLLGPDDQIVSPETPYSFSWYLWPHPILDPTSGIRPGGGAHVQAIAEALNRPQRSFCLLHEVSKVEKLRPRVRWPLRVVVETIEHVLIVTGPEDEGGRAPSAEEPPASSSGEQGGNAAIGTDPGSVVEAQADRAR